MNVLEVKRVGATAVLTLNRPQRRNALDDEMKDALLPAVAELRDDPAVKAVVLTGAGGHFCSGGDVKGFAEKQSRARNIFEGRDRIKRCHPWLDQLIDLEKPVIAAVDGVAYGAGLSLAMASDFVLASPRATFCSAFVRLGYVPDVGTMYLLPRQIGLSRAKEMVFSGRVVEVEEALQIGLVHRIVQGDLLAGALALAERFHHAPTEAIGLAKSVLNRAFESERHTVYAQEAMAQAMCRESEFHQDAVQRFVSKQPARYQW
ncbi:enoyl-CoA hydratase/isomerase family protein [Delftia tsuruhatensis]|uniref:enoyl-CoA hydratase/isomerase family protein n=1 Tax=Delftia tsuruhatensis TaxID=180282 RepID=UPI003D1FDD5D